jgi:hypothetical protein
LADRTQKQMPNTEVVKALSRSVDPSRCYTAPAGLNLLLENPRNADQLKC